VEAASRPDGHPCGGPRERRRHRIRCARPINSWPRRGCGAAGLAALYYSGTQATGGETEDQLDDVQRPRHGEERREWERGRRPVALPGRTVAQVAFPDAGMEEAVRIDRGPRLLRPRPVPVQVRREGRRGPEAQPDDRAGGLGSAAREELNDEGQRIPMRIRTENYEAIKSSLYSFSSLFHPNCPSRSTPQNFMPAVMAVFLKRMHMKITLRPRRQPFGSIAAAAEGYARPQQGERLALHFARALPVDDVAAVLRADQEAMLSPVLEQVRDECSLRHLDVLYSVDRRGASKKHKI